MDTLKSLMSIWHSVADSFCIGQEILVSPRDLHRVDTRSQGEGLRFLTEEMPALASDVYDSFRVSRLTVTCRFQLKGTTALPVFLNRYFSALYFKDGNLRFLDARRQRIAHELLQLLGVFKKLNVDFSDAQLQVEAKKFANTQHDVSCYLDPRTSPLEYGEAWRQAKKLIHGIFQLVDPKDIVLKHAGGSVATPMSNAKKRTTLPGHNEQLNAIFPREKYFFPMPDQFDSVTIGGDCDTNVSFPLSARVAFVPKTTKAPRLISMEQAEVQKVQQGLKDLMYYTIQETDNPSRGYVNFSDQEVNRSLVRESKENGCATIDLSEASDRVAWSHVDYLFPPTWVEALKACRSDFTMMPSAAVPPPLVQHVKLHCMAPMGSAVCFPVEAITFWALAKGLLKGEPFNWVYVYGDDIICHADYADRISEFFHHCGYVVNMTKSFSTGLFRESCGCDVLSERVVTVARFRELNGVRKVSDVKCLQSWAGFMNQFIEVFSPLEGEVLCRGLERTLGVTFPRGSSGAHPYEVNLPSIGFINFFLAGKRRYNRDLQRKEYRMRSTRSVNIDSRVGLTPFDANVLEWSLYEEWFSSRETHRTTCEQAKFRKNLSWSEVIGSWTLSQPNGEDEPWSRKYIFDRPNTTTSCWSWFPVLD